jgi:ABC-type phosphate/phosphonate transport system substrate-binding protein
MSSLQDRPIIYLGFSASREPWLTEKTYRPLGDYLTAHSAYRFQVTVGKDAEELLGFLEERYVDVALLGPLSYLEARDEFGAVALVKPLNETGQSLTKCTFITAPIPNGPITVRPDLPSSVTEPLVEALLSLGIGGAAERADWNETIRYGFVSSSDEDYEPLRQIVNRHPSGCGSACHTDEF